jgi:(p)ppGpp synthase/HD superfamily hydrolase
VLEVPVKLQWPDFSSPEEQDGTFQCEVVVHAQDRKLLLADCSEIVSELSEITKTGSQTTKEHATLVFLVNVQSLSHLQKLMDSLGQVRAVMSAERRVSIVYGFAFTVSASLF